ncbi:MAG TPA: hypothetical protein VF761_14540 [Gemmatimonadaceae bacterium]
MRLPTILALLALGPVMAGAQRPASRPQPLPVVGATRERFAAVDAVTLGDRIFAVERTESGGWLRVYDASDVANPVEIREATAPIVGRPIGIAGDGTRVLVASMTSDTTQLRLMLFDVTRLDRSRWSGAASLHNYTQKAAIEQMWVDGDRAVVQTAYGSVIQVDLAQLERDFAAATGGDETSLAARQMLRALATAGAALEGRAIVPSVIDTVYDRGTRALWSGWDFLQHNQLATYRSRRGTLVSLIGGPWSLDLVEAATGQIRFTTRRPNKQIESLTAPDSAEVFVDDLVRVDRLAGRSVAVFNATIIDPKHRDRAWAGGAFVDITDPSAPRVLGTERRSAVDTSTLRYGTPQYLRDAVFARGAIVDVGDSAVVARVDASGRVTELVPAGRFIGRLVPGPDGTVLELSVPSAWRPYKGAFPPADTTVPAIRIRTTIPRVAVREASAAIALDVRGRSTIPQRIRFEIVAPNPTPDPTRLTITSVAADVPVMRRGGLLDAWLPAGTAITPGVVPLTLSAGDATGRWLALGARPATLGANVARTFVTLDDSFTGTTIVVPRDDPAVADARIAARLPRDTNATIFVAPGSDGDIARVAHRSRGSAEIVASRAMTLASYPAAASVAAVAALRHVGSGEREQLPFCLRDALGKRVQVELDLTIPDTLREVPCGDAAEIRGWLAHYGATVVEGPSAAVVVDRNHLAPFDTLVERTRWRHWTTARADIDVTTATDWEVSELIAREDSAGAPTGGGTSAAIASRALTDAQRQQIAQAVSGTAILSLFDYAPTDSTDSTVAVIRGRLAARVFPGDSARPRAYLSGEQWGSIILGDLQPGRFVPRWEAWSSSSDLPELLDLDGDGVDELLYSGHGRDAHGNLVGQRLAVFDQNGRELTRQRVTGEWFEAQAQPLETDFSDPEYCDTDCGGGFTIGRPGADGTRPILEEKGRWILRDRHYVFQPNPPKPAPKRKRSTRKRASAKPKH